MNEQNFSRQMATAGLSQILNGLELINSSAFTLSDYDAALSVMLQQNVIQLAQSLAGVPDNGIGSRMLYLANTIIEHCSDGGNLADAAIEAVNKLYSSTDANERDEIGE